MEHGRVRMGSGSLDNEDISHVLTLEIKLNEARE